MQTVVEPIVQWQALATENFRKARRLGWFLVIGAVIGFGGGLAGFGALADEEERLAREGTSTEATVVEVDAFRGGLLRPEGYNPGIDVTFTAQDGRTVTAKLSTGEEKSDDYSVGQVVSIFYDPERPTHARLASSDSALPPLAWFAFAPIFGGIFAAVYGLSSIRFGRRGLRTNLNEGKPVAIRKWRIQSGAITQTSVGLYDPNAQDGSDPLGILPASRRNRAFTDRATTVVAYGDLRPRHQVLIVDKSSGAVAGGALRSGRKAKRLERKSLDA